MKRQSPWTVGDWGVRPAGLPTKCFYCDAVRGEVHKEGCVIRRRTVVVKFSVELVVDVPEDWDTDAIEFRYNDSSWCANNLFLPHVMERVDKEGRCLCDFAEAEFIREATAEDEEAQCLKAEELSS